MSSDGNDAARQAWNANARFWDERMADGNDFFKTLIWPAMEKLLALRSGERVIEAACGNGVASRQMHLAGAKVTATDFSTEMIAVAKRRAHADQIDYRIVDATDGAALRALGVGSFDAGACCMGIMDMARIDVLMQAMAELLKPGGRFVFSVTHPCFNNPSTVQMGEQEDREGTMVTTWSIKVPRYLTPFTQVGLGIVGQPQPHPYFHRSLSDLLGAGFQAGLAVTGFEERSFAPENTAGRSPLSWNGRFSEIPPALMVRLQKLHRA